MPAQGPDHLNMSPTRDESPDNIDTLKKQRLARAQNEIGAKVLTLAGFESRQKDIVESSFDKARKNKEKLPGKNNERRNFAYLSRLDSMIEKHGDPLEKRLWNASVDNVIIKPENITDAYWEQREQNRRDDGQGGKLSPEEKEDIVDDIIKNQQRTISAWSDYLGDKDCPYPTWFKVYAFDGVSRMGLLGKETKEFEKRDKSTVAGFPKFNAEVLAKVYRNINEFYGVSKEKWLEDHPDDDKLLSLVRSGNFAKLYAKELFNRKVIVKTPERTEDIKGDWFEYGPGDEEQIADLAEGTGWCVADPYVVQGYFKYGRYVGRHNNKSARYDSKARFIIFRLEDPDSPGNYATNGSASIRLNLDGKVAEVSGLGDRQAIEDSLVPIVKEKAMSLPGGERYLQAFKDKQTLILLDQKMQNNKDLSNDELRFLYELDRPIVRLDTYGADPRTQELKDRYGIKYALDKGVKADDIVSKLSTFDIAHNLDSLISHGANIDIDRLVSELPPFYIAKNLDSLISHGANIDIDNLVSNLYPGDTAYCLDSLISHGANIDIDSLVSKLSTFDIAHRLDFLISHGANIDIDSLVPRFKPSEIAYCLDSLARHGAKIDMDMDSLIPKLRPSDIAHNLDSLISHGANIDIDSLVHELRPSTIIYCLDSLVRHGASIDNIVSELELSDIAYSLDPLINHCANIDIDSLVSKLRPSTIVYNLDSLVRHGASIDNIVSKLHPSNIAYNLDSLISYGANIDIDRLVSKLDSSDITENLDSLVRYGANIGHMAETKNK